MKSFIVSLVLLASIVLGVFINAGYSNKLCDELTDTLSFFPDKADGEKNDAMMEAQDIFIKNAEYFGYVLTKADLLELICDFSDVFSYHSSGDTPSYLASLERVKKRLSNIGGDEDISFRKIFGS